MNGFSNKLSFDPEVLKGQLVTATYKDGTVKSGLISSVSPNELQFTYVDSQTYTFQNAEISVQQVENKDVVLTFARHLTDLASANHSSSGSSSSTSSTASSSTNTSSNQSSELSLQDLLRQHFSFDKIETFIKKQRDEKIIAFILFQLGSNSLFNQNQIAKLLFSLPENLLLPVQNYLTNVPKLNDDTKKMLEDQAKQLIREFLKKNTTQQAQNQSPFGDGNPLGDLFGKGAFQEIFGDNSPFGNIFGNKSAQTPDFQDMVNSMEEMLRKLFGDNNNQNGNR
ncbi:hypothetical protein CN918_25970 [Priestia megaterium]|nr:hypothetical protein CN918_25970 [Priestia megaterium]